MTDEIVSAVGAKRPAPAVVQKVRAPLSSMVRRMRRLDFGPVTGRTADAPRPRLGRPEAPAAEAPAADPEG